MKFADLEFQDHPMFQYLHDITAGMPAVARDYWEKQWLRRAQVDFVNGMTVSIIYGTAAFLHWKPGQYELMTTDPSGDLNQDFQVRGDEKVIQETLDRIERWKTEVTI